MTITLKPMMKSAAIIVASVLVLGIWSAQAPAAASRVRCAPRHDHVLARDGVGELYEAPLEYAVCGFGRYRAHGIGPHASFSSQGGGGIVDPSLGGGYVAYGEESADNEGGGSSYVIVRGIRTGRVFRKVPAAYPEVPLSAREEGGPIYGVVVKPDGSMAWIVQNVADNEVFEVHVVDHRGARVVAIEVTPHSLRLHGNTISWVLADKRVSTTLY